MKVLIWFLCLFANSFFTVILKEAGINLGAIPSVVLFAITIWLAQTLCKKWDEHRKNKEEIKVDKIISDKEKVNSTKKTVEKSIAKTTANSKNTFPIFAIAGGLSEMCIKQISEITATCEKKDVVYYEKPLIISTFIYFYTIWAINLEKLTDDQEKELFKIYSEKFYEFYHSIFDDEGPMVKVDDIEEVFTKQMKTVKSMVLLSYDVNARIFKDEEIFNEYISSFVDNKSDLDKLLPYISNKILNEWALLANEAGKAFEVEKEGNKKKVIAGKIEKEVSEEEIKVCFCRKCGTKLLGDRQFCHKCGTKSINEAPKEETPIKTSQITPIDKLALLTVGLPAVLADKSEEEMNILKNQYVYCDAIIFVEFFIRANALELAPSREAAMKFSDAYIETVIKETLNTIPDTEDFFVDMFYSRATLYDEVVMNSKEPIMDVVELLTHIIHKEIDDVNYVITDDKNYRYFGGIIENLTIKTEIVNLFQCINDTTEDTMKELKDYMDTL